MKAVLVMRGRIERVAEPAAHFIAGDDRGQHVAAGGADHFADRERGRHHGRARMQRGIRMGIVEVEGMAERAVEQRRHRRRPGLGVAEHGGFALAVERRALPASSAARASIPHRAAPGSRCRGNRASAPWRAPAPPAECPRISGWRHRRRALRFRWPWRCLVCSGSLVCWALGTAATVRRQHQLRRVSPSAEPSGRDLPQHGADDQPVKRQDDRKIGPSEPIMGLHQRGRGDILALRPDVTTSTTTRKSRWLSLKPATSRSGVSLTTGKMPIMSRGARRRGARRFQAERRDQEVAQASAARRPIAVTSDHPLRGMPRIEARHPSTTMRKASANCAPASSAPASMSG